MHKVPAWGLDACGRPRVAVLMVLADHIMTELPYMRRPDQTWALTSELTLDVIGDLPKVDSLVAEAVDITRGDEAFVQCRITDTAGTLVAVGTARAVFVAATAEKPIDNVLPQPPIDQDPVDIEGALELDYRSLDDGVEVSLAEPGSWVNVFGIMHGGVAACVTELAASAAIGERNPDLATGSVHTSFLRPVLGGSPFVALARPYRVGRSSAVVEVLGRGVDGALCTVSMVTARSIRTVDR